jgi:hypothetical protein
LTMSPNKENLNGCKEQTRNEDEGIDSILEAFETYVCDELCCHRGEKLTQEEMDWYCCHCELQQYTDKIREEYEKVNDFGKSQAGHLMNKYRKITLCKDCGYRGGINKPHCAGKMSGIAGVLTEGDGCSRGIEEK